FVVRLRRRGKSGRCCGPVVIVVSLSAIAGVVLHAAACRSEETAGRAPVTGTRPASDQPLSPARSGKTPLVAEPLRLRLTRSSLLGFHLLWLIASSLRRTHAVKDRRIFPQSESLLPISSNP